MSLKRLLIGSISLSEDSQPDEENEVGQSEGPGQDVEQHQLTGLACFFVFLLSFFFFSFLRNSFIAMDEEKLNTTHICKLNRAILAYSW